MAEVGVLNLTIHDNSETAGQGLDFLAGALGRVRDAVRGGLNLANGQNSVAMQVKKLATEVSNSSTVIKNLGTLFNAISNFAKLKDITINTQPITDLKTALDGGIPIGKAGTEINKLREALAGEWNSGNATLAADSMKAIAAGAVTLTESDAPNVVKKMANSIKEYASAVGSITGGGAHNYLQQQVFSYQEAQIAGQNLAEGIRQGIAEMKEAVAATVKELCQESIIDTTHTTLEEHSPSHVGRRSGNNYGLGLSEGLVESKSEVQRSATELAETINNSVQNTIVGFGSPAMLKTQLTDFVASPLESITQKYLIAGEAARTYGDKVSAIIPTLRDQRDLAMGVESKKDFAGYQQQSAQQLVEKVHEAASAADNVTKQVQSTNSELHTTKQAADEVASAFNNVKNEVSASSGEIQSQIKATNEQLEEQLRIRRELNAVADQKRLESNYPQFRELYMSGEGDWSQRVTDMYGFTQKAFEEGETYAEALKITMQEVNQYIDDYINKTNTPAGPLLRDTIDNSFASNLSNKLAEDSASTLKFVKDVSDGMKEAQSSTQSVSNSFDHAKTETRVLTDEMAGLDKELKQKKTDMNEAASGAKKLAQHFADLRSGVSFLKGGIERMFPTMTGLIKQFTRMAKMRAIRYIIRQIAQGFKEGVQNVYEYSKAVGSDFAPSMDSAASSLAQMKNALGASLAPLLQSLIPVLKNVVNWFINLSNYVNQFLALMRGQTSWVKALPVTTEAFKKQEKAAKKTGSAIKDLLADWDELNIIQGDTSGAGSGAGTSAAEDYLSMFETVTEFDKKVKDLVGWIQEHMEEIKSIAAAIGAAILMWKFSSAFLMGISELAGLATIGAISLAVGLQLTWTGAYAAGKKGEFDTTALLETAGGMLLSTIGGALIGYMIGGPWGSVIGAATGLIASIAVAVKAYYDGERSRKLAEKWGTLHLTDEEIQELVGSQVTAKVAAELEIISASVSNRKQAKAKADKQIQLFSISLETAKFSLDTDSSAEGISSALEAAKEAIDAIQASLDADREGLKLSFTKFTYKDKEGNDITAELYSSLMEGNLELTRYFKQMGDDISYYLSLGFEEGLESREYIMAMQLMESLNNIVSSAERNYEANKFVRENKAKMDNAYDMETAQKIFDEQEAKLAEYRSTTTAQLKEDIESQYRNLEYFKAIQEDYAAKGDTNKVAEYAKYISDTQTAIDNLNDTIKQIDAGTYDWMKDDTYAGMYYRMQEMWQEKLKELYKDSYYKYLFDEDVTETEITPRGEMKQVTHKAESPFDNNPTAYNIMRGFNISEAEWLTDDEIAEYVKFLIDKYNGDQKAAYEEATQKLPKFKGAMVDMYFPDLSETINGKEKDLDTKIRDSIYAMYLSGVAEGSERWKTMVSAGEEAYGKDQFDAAIEQYKNLGSAYLRMIEDMNYGMPSEDFIARNKYAEDLYPGFVKQFMDYFSDRFTENDKNAPNIPGSKAETIEPIKKSVDAINSLGDWWENVNKEFTEWTSSLPFFYKPPEEITEVTQGAVVKIEDVDVVIEDPDGLRKELEEQVEYLLRDSRLEDWERNALNNTYGEELVNKVLKEMYYTFDEEGYLTGNTQLQRLAAAGVIAGNRTVSDVGWTPRSTKYVEEGTTGGSGESDAQMQTNIESGTQRGTQSLLDVMRDLLIVTQAINRKDFTVNITPSSTMGSVMNNSIGLFGRVTGD